MKKYFSFLLFVFISLAEMKAQRSTEIMKPGLFHSNYYLLKEGEVLYFKLQSGSYDKGQIALLADSFLVLKSGLQITYQDFHKIRFNLDRHLLGTFRQFFFGIGIGFFALNTFNQWITGNRPILQESALIVSAACLTISAVLREFGMRRLKVTPGTQFRLIEIDYQYIGK